MSRRHPRYAEDGLSYECLDLSRAEAAPGLVRGLYTHPLSQILDCPETARELAARVGVSPFSVFRAGRSAPPPRSARLLDFAQDMY